MSYAVAGNMRHDQIAELEEHRLHAYESTKLYKERTKKIHDSQLKTIKQFYPGDEVLLYNSRLKLFPGKLKSRWSGPYTVVRQASLGSVLIKLHDQKSFMVTGHRLKKYLHGLAVSSIDVHYFALES